MKGTEFTSGAVKAVCKELDGIRRAITAKESGDISVDILLRIENLEAAVAGINEKVAKIAAVVLGENDTTPQIDTFPEMIAFLANKTNDQKLDDVVSGTVDADGIVHY